MDKLIINVFVNIDEKDIKVGQLFVNYVRGKESYAFEFSDSYLKEKRNDIIEPRLQLTNERQFSNELFGFINDTIPDRWGKKLIKRGEEQLAKKEKRHARTLLAMDYLLSVSDISRLGALRFKKEGEDAFANAKSNVPPYLYLNKLANLSYNVDDINDNELLDLLSPGSSLGGARAKASIYGNNHDLYIAKFPTKNDEIDVELWEKITNDLAALCNLDVPNNKLVEGKYGHIFLVKRFDRENNKRLPFVSMMSLLGAKDGENNNYSYLDLVDIINTYSNQPKKDLIELFKRIAFNILIHNGDDHLRNHALIKKNKRWKLSPVFDINLSLDFHGLSLSLDGFTNSFDLNALINISQYFHLKTNEAQLIINKMKTKIKNNFLVLAHKYKAKKEEIEQFKILFN